MYGRTYTVPEVPFTMCVSPNESICLHAAPWQENAGKPFGMRTQPWLCAHAAEPRPLAVPQHPERHTHHDSGLS